MAPTLQNSPVIHEVGASSIEVDSLLRRFETADREAVRSFLLGDPVSLQLFSESVPEIEKVFGGNVPVALEPVVDPETNDPPELWALIRDDTGDVTGALERLSNFKKAWWYAVRLRAGGRIGFDVEMFDVSR